MFLKSFLCLFNEQNLSRASAKLYISSQGLSKQVQALEEQLGLSLFERSSTGMKPTKFGEAIYPLIKNICDEYDKLEALAKHHLSQMQKTVTIDIPIGFADVVKMEMIHEIRRRFPELEIIVQELESDVCRGNLLSEKADIAFLTPMTDLSMLDCYEFRWDGAAIIVNKNHPLALRNQPVYAQDLYGLLLYRRVYRKTAGDYFRHCTDAKKYNKASIIAVGYNENKLLDVTNEGAAVLDVKSTMNDITHPDLRILDVEDIFSWTYCCIKKNSLLSKNAKLVLEAIKQYPR